MEEIAKRTMDLALKFRWTKIEKGRKNQEGGLTRRKPRSKDFFE